MKRLSNLKLSSLIFGILMCLPMFSVLARVIYVQSNPNAKDSYYGETINEIEYNNINYDNLVQNNDYVLTNSLLNTLTSTSQTTMTISNLNILSPQISFDYSNATQMRFYVNSEGIPRIYLYNVNNQAIGNPFDLNNVLINFEFKFNGWTNISYNTTLLGLLNFQYKIYNDYSYIDNVFDYSLSKFLEEDNYSLNFFNFFENVFLNQSGKNMLYINFLNWYMNYVLLVSSAYCLFFVLYFFINMVRQLVMSFTNKIDGGF